MDKGLVKKGITAIGFIIILIILKNLWGSIFGIR